MEVSLFDKNGIAVAYISTDYNNSIYLWGGSPVAYLYEDKHVYGINGKHLGWFEDDILYDNNGERIGFTFDTCPVATAKETVKSKKLPMYELMSKYSAPPQPHFSFNLSEQDFEEFLKVGEAPKLMGVDKL